MKIVAILNLLAFGLLTASGQTSPCVGFYEPFDYPAGLSLSGQSNQTFCTVWQSSQTHGMPITIAVGSLSLPELEEAIGNSVQLYTQVGGAGPSCSLPFGGEVISNELYFSALVKVLDTRVLPPTGIGVMGLRSSGTQPEVGPHILVRSTAGGYNLGLTKGTGQQSSVVWDDQVLNENEVVCVIGGYTFITGEQNNDVVEAWVLREGAPEFEEESPAPSLSVVTGPDVTDLSELVLWQFASANTNFPWISVDRTVVGLGWSSIFGRDYGDAPDGYPVTRAEDGARHRHSTNWKLGNRWDREFNGHHSANANYDDKHWIFGWPSFFGIGDDEDGVSITAGWGNISAVVVAGTDGYLDAWVDFNRDGDWDDDGEQVFTSEPLVEHDEDDLNILSIPVPCYASDGDFVSRWRFSATGGLLPRGYGGKGEVEDYIIRDWHTEGEICTEFDYGDAPDSFQTLFDSDGARHDYSGLVLGTHWDAEMDGQPSADCLLDDITGSPDDEDGVYGLLFDPDLAVADYVKVVVTGGSGLLDAWIDWNGDGVWDGSEHVIDGWSVTAGDNLIPVPTPPGVLDGFRCARFRLTSTGAPKWFGYAADGEVEDYLVEVRYGSGPGPHDNYNENPRIEIKETDGSIRVTWDAIGMALEQADTPLGPWTTVSNATSPYTVVSDAPRTFFRLVGGN